MVQEFKVFEQKRVLSSYVLLFQVLSSSSHIGWYCLTLWDMVGERGGGMR